jgi:ubiquinone/menaquinone biosynthesis C-methylase UbiE
MKRTMCSACGSVDLRQFLDLGESPIADAYTDSPDDPSPTHPLQVAVCGKCHLVQLLEVVDDLFGTGYSFYTSASPPLSDYHRRYADDVIARHGDLAARGVVEVGCNDGDLLRHFAAAGYPTLGVDPATGPADVARDRGLIVHTCAFTVDVAEHIRAQDSRPGLIIANHVLAHVADVADMLAGIAGLLADDGVAMIEVQYLQDLLVNNAFDLVYHEHRNFFSLGSLANAAAQWGLHVVDAELTDRQGGSLRVTLAKRGDMSGEATWIRQTERWLDDLGMYDGMQGRVERIRDRLFGLVMAEKQAGRRVAGYGAPAKATTLLNFCGLDRGMLTHVVDTTPAKQGRHVPGTGLRIVAPDGTDVEPPDTLLLLAWNYMPTIIRNYAGFTAAGGRWIVPIPAPVVI